jgi:hypothetical protein
MGTWTEPVGVQEIADRLCVDRRLVAMWKSRGQMPEPDGVVSGAPAWDWPKIEEWARRTGRLVDPFHRLPTSPKLGGLDAGALDDRLRAAARGRRPPRTTVPSPVDPTR